MAYLRLIHTCHAVHMPCPCSVNAVLFTTPIIVAKTGLAIEAAGNTIHIFLVYS